MIRGAVALLCSGCTLFAGCALYATNAPEPGKPCNTSEASPIADGALAGLSFLGTVVSIDEATSEFGDSDAGTFAVITGLIGVAFAASAVRGLVNIGKCRRHQRELYDDAVALAKRRAAMPGASHRHDAWELTRTAAKAARSGDCETVIAVDKVLRGLDDEFHRSVFTRDVAIARCFTTDEIDVPPPTETTTPPELQQPAPEQPAPTP